MPNLIPASLKARFPTIMALVLTIGFFVLAYTRLDLMDTSFLTNIEYRWIDRKFLWRGEQTPGDEVVIVAVDDRTLAKLGSFRTLRHDTIGDLVTRLAA